MKIMHVDFGKEWRGGQRQCALLHNGLLKRGIESVLVCNRNGKLCNSGLPNTVIMSCMGELNPQNIFTLRNLIHEFKPDILHTHEAHSLTPLLVLRQLNNDFKLVHTRRVDFSVNKNAVSLYKYNNKYITLVAISEGVKNVLIDDGIPAGKINIIHSGVPAPEVPSQAAIDKTKLDLGFTDNDFVIGTTASLSDHKDIPTMLYAFKIALESMGNLKLLIVGDGPLYTNMVSLAKKLGIDKSTIFTGFRSDIAELVSVMNIYIVSSKKEGLNTSIIDAMHLGKAIVATAAGGIPELVLDKKTGLLSPVADAKGFAVNILRVAEDKELRALYGKNGAEHAKNFTSDAMVDGYIKLYSRLLG